MFQCLFHFWTLAAREIWYKRHDILTTSVEMLKSSIDMQPVHLSYVFSTLERLFTRIIQDMTVFVVPISCPLVNVCIGCPQKPQEEWEMGGGTAVVNLMTSRAALPLADTGGCRVYKPTSSILKGSIKVHSHFTGNQEHTEEHSDSNLKWIFEFLEDTTTGKKKLSIHFVCFYSVYFL